MPSLAGGIKREGAIEHIGRSFRGYGKFIMKVLVFPFYSYSVRPKAAKTLV